MKKIIAIILSLAVILSFVSVTYAETTEVNAYEIETGFLAELGLLPSEFSPEAPMSRGNFAKMLADLIYNEIDVTASHETSFSDLQFGTEYYNAVSVLEALKIVKGNGNGFNPDGQISLQDALVMSLRALGYEQVAAANGGYPAGYFYTAKLTGLTKGISGVSALDGKTAVKLIYNMLFISHMGIESIESDGAKLGIDYTRNFLKSELNIERYDARIINDGMVSYDNDSILDDRIVIEDLKSGNKITVKCKDKAIGELFGYNIDAYVKYDKDSGCGELVYAGIKNTNSQIVIDAEDILNTSLLQIEYEKDITSGKIEKALISDENPAIFRNGIRLTQASASDLKPEFGNVKLIDNNNDKKADVVIITDVKSNIVAGSVAADYSSIVCKINPVNSIDLEEDTVRFRVYKDGKISDVSEIKEGNVISVAPSEITKSGYQLYTLFVSDKIVSGVVSATDEGNRLVYINDTEYEVSQLYFRDNTNLYKTLKSGENTTVYLDFSGKISYIEGIKANNVNFAYLLNVNSKGEFDDLRVVLYSKYGTFSNHVVSDNITIDGEHLDGKSLSGANVSKKDELCELLNLRPDGTILPPAGDRPINPRLAIIKVNTKGQIYYIDTDNRTYNDDSLEYSDPYVLTAGERYFRTERLYFSSAINYGTPDGTFLVGNDTLILQVPDVDRYNIPEDYSSRHMDMYEMPLSELSGYKLISYNEMNTYQRYDMQPYNIDPKTGVADILVLRGYNDYGVTKTDYTQSSDFVIFKKLSQIYNPEKKDQDLYKMYYIAQDGTEGSVFVDKNNLSPFYKNIIFGGTFFDDQYNDIPVEKLEPGDIFYFEAEAKYLKSLGRLVNYSDINNAYVTHMTATISNTPYKNVYGPASNNTIDIPYDVRRGTAFTGYGQTYFFSLASAQSMEGTIVKCALPYVNSEKNPTWVGTFNDHYNYGTDCLIKYVPFDAAEGKILVVDEIRHSSTGNCDIKVTTGTLNDIKTADSFASDGFRKSSKLFFYSQAGVARNLIIFNLHENHR